MRLAILSDIHANLEALRATIRDRSAQAVDLVVCLGDIVGYDSDPAACIELLQELDALCVAGDHDRAVAGQITTEGFAAAAVQAIAWTRERLTTDHLGFLAALPLQASVERHLVAVHGTLRPDGGCERTDLDDDARRRQCLTALAQHPSRSRICAHGHTHRPGIVESRDRVKRAPADDVVHLRVDAHYQIDPGTVGQPRKTRDRRATYIVLDTTRRVVAVRRVAYDHARARAKSRKAGLAPRRSMLPAVVHAPVRWAAGGSPSLAS